MLSWLADRILYYNWGPSPAFPASREAAFEDVFFDATDGTRLHARWYECPHDWPAPCGRTRPTVLFFHGNAGDVDRWRHVGSRWQDSLGANVLVVDFRGYGRSRGRPSAASFALDSRAAHAWLMQRDVDPSRLVLVGQSLGGGVVVELATSGVEHAALVLESTFTNVRAVADGLLWNRLPLGRLLRDAYPSEELLDGYDKPMFVSHGDEDRLIPVEHARRLVEVTSGPTELLVIPGLRHHDKRPETYGAAVREFLSRHLAWS